VTLALSVGVLLLGALYVAVDVQLRHARAGRNIVEQATLARSLLARIDADIAATSAIIDSERYRIANSLVATTSGFTTIGSGTTASGSTGTGTTGSSSGASGGGSSNSSASLWVANLQSYLSSTSGGSTSSNSSGGSTNGNSSGGSTSGNSTSGSSNTTTDGIVLPLSVQGDNTTLNLYIARVPREALPTDASVIPPVVSDLRRVSWWLPTGGLARQEVAVETAVDALDNLPPGIPDEDSYVIAPEVQNVQFQYFDGSEWQDTWDCTTLGADGVTPIGPPQAIAIVLDIATPQDGAKENEPPTKRYRHVVACITANGTTLQTQQQQQSGQQQNGTGGTNQ
jgi:hypothetical protein